MTSPELQQKAVKFITELVPYDGEKPDKETILEAIDNSFSGNEKELLMRSLLRTAVKLEYDKPIFVMNPILKALAAGELEVTYNSLKAKPWHGLDREHQGIFDFSNLEGARFTLHLVMKDVLTGKYGEEGRRLANSMVVMQSGVIPSRQIKHYLQFDDNNYVLEGGDVLMAREIASTGINPFANVKVLEIGGGSKSYPQFMPLIGLLGAYDNVNDHSGGFTIGAIPASVAMEGFVTHENFKRHLQPGFYGYVVTSNVISHKAVGDDTMPIEEKLYYTGSLFMACAAGVKRGGKIIHLNGYDKERVPALADREFHELCGITSLETKAITSEGRTHVYVYMKGDRGTEVEKFKAFYDEKRKSWELLPPFELGKGGTIVKVVQRI